MRPEILEPAGGIDAISASGLHNVLLVVGHNVPAERIRPWTLLERALAYDYAMREHLKASDNQIKVRPCPSFVTAADQTGDT